MKTFEFHEYWAPAVRQLYVVDVLEVTDVELWTDSNRRLDADLGVTQFAEWRGNPSKLDTSMPEKLKQTLKQLAGPHGKTLLQVIKARNSK